ncbi:MAG: GNAT family N-acetyltransferase [Bdellovibrionaceae bacterium]|nr:GNAT family N-acetyltransferase [Pseudobdellovibrionaceae bacterium]
METIRCDLNQSPQLGVIKAATFKDAQAILDIYSPYIHDKGVTFETSLPSLTEMERRITENSKLGYFVCELNGQVIGYAYASKHRERAAYQWCCEVSAYVNEKYHGKMVASGLYSHLFRQLKDLGYVNVYAGITLPNEKSVRFHEAIGFKYIGTYEKIGFKLERWHDVGWWGFRLQEPPVSPEKPAHNQETSFNSEFDPMAQTNPAVQRTFSGAPWEEKVGYCRAIRMGNTIAVTGTTSVAADGRVFAVGKPYEQAKRCLEIIEKAIALLGATLKDVIRTRIFVTDIKQWQEYGRAHGEFFANHPPATTMVEVKALIDPDMMVEIEADAILTTTEEIRI